MFSRPTNQLIKAEPAEHKGQAAVDYTGIWFDYKLECSSLFIEKNRDLYTQDLVVSMRQSEPEHLNRRVFHSSIFFFAWFSPPGVQWQCWATTLTRIRSERLSISMIFWNTSVKWANSSCGRASCCAFRPSSPEWSSCPTTSPATCLNIGTISVFIYNNWMLIWLLRWTDVCWTNVPTRPGRGQLRLCRKIGVIVTRKTRKTRNTCAGLTTRTKSSMPICWRNASVGSTTLPSSSRLLSPK